MTKTETPDLAGGWLEGRTHVLPLRVYYEDTDLSGLVYHATYLRFMERGRSDFLRLAGLGHQSMLKSQDPLVWAVRRVVVDFMKPARVEDLLLVRTQVREVTGARMKLGQTVLRDEEELVSAEVEACLLALDGKPRRVPEDIRTRLEAFCPA